MMQIRFAIFVVLLASVSNGYAQNGQSSDASHPYVQHLNELHASVPLELQPPAVSLTDAQRRVTEAKRLVAQAEEKLAEAAKQATAAEDKAKADLQAQAKAAQAKAAQLRADSKAKEKARLAAQVRAAQLKADAKSKEQQRKNAIEDATDSPSDVKTEKAPLADEGSSKSAPAKKESAKSKQKDAREKGASGEDAEKSPASQKQTAPIKPAEPGAWSDFNNGAANSYGVTQNPYVDGSTYESGCSPICHCDACGQGRQVVVTQPQRLGIRRLGHGNANGHRKLGNGQVIKSTANHAKQAASHAKQVVQQIRCGAPACDLVGGCDEPGGCRGIGVIGAIKDHVGQKPVRNAIRNIGNGQSGLAQGGQMQAGQMQAGQMQGILPEQIFQPRHPAGRLRANVPLLSDRPLLPDGSLLANRPLRTLAQRVHCGSQGCAAAGGCDQIGGCGLFDSGIGNRLGGFRLRSANSTRNPGTLLMWRGQANACSLPTLDDPIVTDRPSFTPASSVVGLGVAQAELGYTYSFNDDAPGSIKTHSYPETLLRYGAFCDWFELRLGWNTLDTNINGSEYNGAEDLLLGFKIGLTSQSGIRPEMALIHRMRVPTGSDFFSKDEVLNGLGLAYRWELNDTLSFAGSTQLDRDIDPWSDDSFTMWAQSLMLGVSINERMAAYTEYFGLYPHSADYVRPQHFINGGLTYLINNDLQWDVRYGVNLDDRNGDDFDNYFAGMGLSLRLR